MSLALRDLEVRLEKINDGQVTGGLAIRQGAGLQDEPVLGAVGVGELVDKPGLADACLPHDGNELPVAFLCESKSPADLLDLGLATDEARQPSGGGDVQPASLGACSGECVNFHGLWQSLDRDWSPAHDLHVAFGETKRGGSEQD